MITYVIIAVTSASSGLICAAVAKQNGKDPTRWFLIGVLLNVIALAILFAVWRKKND